MGLIKALVGAVGGALADTWQEVIEPDNMSDTTVFCKGVKVRKNDKRISSKILYFEKKYGKIEQERSMRRGFLAAIFKKREGGAG